jgi:hypothetical protein
MAQDLPPPSCSVRTRHNSELVSSLRTNRTWRPAYRDLVVRAEVSDTRTVGRDFGLIRVLANDFSDSMFALEHSGAAEGDRRAQFLSSSLKDAALYGDVDGGKVEAGQSAGLIDSVMPAADIVASIVAEYLVDTRAELCQRSHSIERSRGWLAPHGPRRTSHRPICSPQKPHLVVDP